MLILLTTAVLLFTSIHVRTDTAAFLYCRDAVASSFQSVMDGWLTTGDQGSLLAPVTSLTGVTSPAADVPIVTVTTSQTDQPVLGFGAALSNSAAYLIYNSPERSTIIKRLFSSDDADGGISIDFIRLVMGGSDFNAVPPYSYDDMPPGQTDFELDHFSIDKDFEFTIPLLKEILQVNPSLKIVATSWSAPGWMKDTDSLYGGNFLDGSQYQAALAGYFVRFIQAYQAQGIHIHAVTLQNEPEHSAGGYPTMKMTSAQQRDLIRDHVGPQFSEHGIATQVWVWDHNWDGVSYVEDVLSDAVAAQYVTGSAWHCYAGDSSQPAEIRERYPDKALYFTECSGGEWDTNFASSLIWNIETLFIGQTRLGAETVLLWNLALDENFGPRVDVSGCTNCRGVLEIPSTGGFTNNVEFYSIGHFSKFVRQSAMRVDSTMPGSGIQSAAFINPDGSVAVVIINTSWDSSQSFQVELDGLFYVYSDLPSRSVITLVRPAVES